MKKKVMFCMSSMYLGGAERSLIGLLHCLDYSKVEVDLFLNQHAGELFHDIPEQVHILEENDKYVSLAEPIKQTIYKGNLRIACSRLFAKAFAQIKCPNAKDAGVRGDYLYRYSCWALPRIQKNVEYDVAISFIQPHYFVIKKVRAKKKIAWIHTDYTAVHIDYASQIKMWQPYDNIISISEKVTKSFINTFPILASKVVLIENILPMKLINRQATAFDVEQEMPSDTIKLLSVGRFSYPKNFDEVPRICKKIIEAGIEVKWYLIGYGSDAELIQQKINDEEMQKYVIVLGKKDNPYPYMKHCDVYIQPSRYEGKAVTVREAQALGKAVIITNYATASSQLNDGINGIIVPMDSLKCAEGIVALLKNRERIKQLEEECQKSDFSNSDEVNKLYELIGV